MPAENGFFNGAVRRTGHAVTNKGTGQGLRQGNRRASTGTVVMISTSEIKVSRAIDEKLLEPGVRVPRGAFELEKPKGLS